MSKRLFIAEKPSVAQEFARVLNLGGMKKNDGYLESENTIVTWCVGHLVTMSYPEVYDASWKKWALEPLPFLPKDFKYEVIPSVKKQFNIVKGLLCREDVETIYVCTDSGREGEYIYRLVDRQAGVPETKRKLRVWIDSQTEDEIKRGIKEAKPISEYNNICNAAYLRAKEDYLMGINFSRVLTLQYGNWLTNTLSDKKWSAVSVGRVMTCVLGMVVRREIEIRKFVKTPFYRVMGEFQSGDKSFQGEWKAVEGSKYFNSPALYKENGFKEKSDAMALIDFLTEPEGKAVVEKVEKKKEKKNPPLLFNLAELQNLASKLFKISPDQTLQIIQELYEKKLVTYPRTDARVLSSAVAKEIDKNIRGIAQFPGMEDYCKNILSNQMYKGLEKTRYVNDKQITDHYAIVPTGQGISAFRSLSDTSRNMYEVIVRRFLSIFYPAAVYQKMTVTVNRKDERFFTNAKVLLEPGFLPVSQFSFVKGKDSDEEEDVDTNLPDLKKGMELLVVKMELKEGETSPPKRYNSGSIILAMESAGQLIEDEELRVHIKGSGIGTSATRSEILKKLFNISYLNLNKKTQTITPTLKGELIYGIVGLSIPAMLNPTLTASWEKGLGRVEEGNVTESEYMGKLENYVRNCVIKGKDPRKRGENSHKLGLYYRSIAPFYKK